MSSIHDLKIRAEFTNEMLDQIRAVVREELQVVFTEVQRTLQRMEQSRDTSTDTSLTEENMTQRANEMLKGYARKTWKDTLYPFTPIAPLPPNTLRNADGTPYSAGHDKPMSCVELEARLSKVLDAAWKKDHCFVCADRCQQLCIVCEQAVCHQHIASDLRPGDHVICVECDKITPDREQAYKHYVLRQRLKMR